MWNYIYHGYSPWATDHVFIMLTYITRVHAHPGKTIFIKLYKCYRAPHDRRLEKRRRKEEIFILQNQKREEIRRCSMRYNQLRHYPLKYAR